MNQPAIHRFFESVNNNINISGEGGDTANRRVNVDEMEDKSSDEERFDLPYNEEIDDAEGNAGSDSTDIEVLPSKKKRVIDSDDSDDDGFVVQ